MKKNLLVFVSVLALSLISGCCCDKVCAAEKPAAKAKKHMIIGSWMIEDLPAATAKKSSRRPKLKSLLNVQKFMAAQATTVSSEI